MFQRIVFLAAALLAAALSSSETGAQAFSVAPTRIVLTPDEPAQPLLIANRSTAPLQFRFTWVYYAMDADGRLIETEAPADSAISLLRYGPRAVSAVPGGTTTVRIDTRPGSSISGERRAHLRVTAMPAVPADESEEIIARFGVQLGYDVPVFVRGRDIDQGAEIETVEITSLNGSPAISLTLRRTGADSVWGDIDIRDRSGEIGRLIGPAVYETTPIRRLTIPLDRAPEGRVRLRYRQGERTLAETELTP